MYISLSSLSVTVNTSFGIRLIHIRFQMNSYIDEQGISLYLKDALNQFCQLRRSKPSLKSSPLSPGAYDQSNIAQFLSEYCRSVQYGTHLYKREYEYIMLTTRNRLRFEIRFDGQRITKS